MGILNLNNVGIVVSDLDLVTQFFVDLGLTLLGRDSVEGEWVDHCTGVTGARSRISMLETADGRGRLELAEYLSPVAGPGLGAAPANTLGLHRVCFQVDDLDAALAIADGYGCAPLGQVAEYEDLFRMCYLRGPEGIVVMLAEPLRDDATDAVTPSQ